MTDTATRPDREVRYQPDERPPTALAFGLGSQQAVLCIAGVVLTPIIVIRAAGGNDSYMTWAIFAALLVSGLTTIMQAVRLGRIGAGYPLLMGTSGAFIAVCVTALVEGGPGLLATLVAISALFQFALSERLSLLRRIVTPTVAGTVIMLIAVTVMPIVFGMLNDVPEGTSPAAAPASAATTFIVIAALALRATGAWRLWMPLIGLVAGCVVASFFGLYDIERVLAATWVGFPSGGWPGFDLEFGPAFWGLLPAFVFVTLIGATETIGDSIAIQRIAWRKPRAVDFRAVQGAVAADGAGNLLSGLAGTVPNTTYSTSIAITELTGVAARSVGVWIGVVFVVAAFLPIVAAALLAIPSPVVAAYATVLLSLLFVLGMQVVVQGGVDYRESDDCRYRVLGRSGVPESGDLRGRSRRVVGFAAGQRHDRGRPDRHRADPFHGADRAEEQARRDRAHRRGIAGRRRVPARVRVRAEVESCLDSAALLGRRGGALEPGQAGCGRRSAGEATAARDRARQPQVGGAGVLRRARRGEPGGPDGPPDRTRRRRAGRARDLAPAAAPLRVVGVSPAVPRHGHRDGAGGGRREGIA